MRQQRVAAVVALLAVPLLYATVVGVVVVLEIREQHGRAADNLVFDDHSVSRLMALPLSRVVDLIVPAPSDADESLAHFEWRGFGYVVAAFLDALVLVCVVVAVLWALRRLAMGWLGRRRR